MHSFEKNQRGASSRNVSLVTVGYKLVVAMNLNMSSANKGATEKWLQTLYTDNDNKILIIIFCSMTPVFIQWSYGVTMWEIFTCGRVPYAGIHAMGLLKELKRGGRLEKPDNKACHDDILVLNDTAVLVTVHC